MKTVEHKTAYALHGVHVSSVLRVFDGLLEAIHLQQDSVASLQSQQTCNVIKITA